MKIETVKMIGVDEWDNLVKETYGRPYEFQQQDGCKSRGIHRFSVPDEDTDDYENDTVPEVVNHTERGVSFKAWLARDPKKPLLGSEDDYGLDLWWGRNFYPDFQTVANDLCARGLIEPREYVINIDF